MVDDLEAILEVGSAAAVEIAASALAQHGTPTGTCANCAKPLIGAYCAVCGQPTHTRRRSVRALLHDFLVDIVNFDSRILRTARALLLQPGELPKAFRQGRTQPFVPSIRLYLFMSLAFFVLLGVTHIALLQVQVIATPTKVIWDAKGNPFVTNPAYDKDETDPAVRKLVPPLVRITREKALRPGGLFTYGTDVHFFAPIGTVHSNLSAIARQHLVEEHAQNVQIGDKAAAGWVDRNVFAGLNRIAADPAALNEPLTTWMPRALFLLLPLYALILAFFHIRRRKDFLLVDHLVFSLSVHTFAFFALILAVGLAQLVPGELAAWLLFGMVSLYIFAAMKRFYEQGWFMTTLKFLFVSGLYSVFFLLPAMGVVLLLSFFGGSLG